MVYAGRMNMVYAGRMNSGAKRSASCYRVGIQVIFIVAKAAQPFDRQHAAGNYEVFLGHLEGMGDALLLCQLLLFPAVFAADIWPHTKIV